MRITGMIMRTDAAARIVRAGRIPPSIGPRNFWREPLKAHVFLCLALLAPLLSACGAGNPAGTAAQDSDSPPLVTVYKSPTCGCCGLWVDHMREAGFAVEVIEEQNLSPRKAELGVPPGMGSCHTATVGGYVIEGHVPADDVRRLLMERPPARGLAVPGMPIGSPGMEMGSRRDPYTVWLLRQDGPPQAFAHHGQGGS